ncbi:MAG: T9SS type A sorting domain-containing protein [Chlorobi bacterium]|nr:T9SS type A sorting domain-containing protein [Chlorobiota bacterium]
MKILIIISLILAALITKLLYSQSNITYDAGTNIEIQTGADVCADAIIINGTYSGTGTICQGALPVSLSSFISSVDKNNVNLSWVTEWEINNSGFRIERMKTIENQWKEIWFVAGHGTTNEPKNYTFEDKKLQTANYKYRLKQIDYNGNYEYFTLENDVVVAKPNEYNISQNYPNPSNPKSKIDFELAETGKVRIILYNMLGQEVITIVNESRESGYYTVDFDGSNLASGVYFYRITAGGNSQSFTKTLKMILVK